MPTDAVVANNPPTWKEKQQVEEYGARKAKPRFYADENFPAQAATLLRKWGAKVKTVQETFTRGDENHAAYALRHGLVLVTCDRDFVAIGVSRLLAKVAGSAPSIKFAASAIGVYRSAAAHKLAASAVAPLAIGVYRRTSWPRVGHR
jgi:hypothetical protein